MFSRYMNHNNRRRNNSTAIEAGFNLVQMVITLAVISILTAIAAPSISFGANPLAETGSRVKSQIKLSRTKAMSNTTAYRFKAITNNQIEIQQHLPKSGSSMSNCNDAAIEVDGNGKTVWKKISGYSKKDFTFEEGIQLTSASVNGQVLADVSDWQLCFNSRGLPDQTLELIFTQASSEETIKLEVFMGGAVRIN